MDYFDRVLGIVRSPRFQAAAAAILLVVTDGFGMTLTLEQLLGVVTVVTGWIVSDGIKTSGSGDAVVQERVARKRGDRA